MCRTPVLVRLDGRLHTVAAPGGTVRLVDEATLGERGEAPWLTAAGFPERVSLIRMFTSPTGGGGSCLRLSGTGGAFVPLNRKHSRSGPHHANSYLKRASAA